MKLRAGIEALSIAVPQRYLEIEDLAKARGVDPAKFTAGLGQQQMAVPEPGEDTVALAATAAARLIASNDVDPGRIGMLIVGTETGVDHSKAVASFVQGLLKLPTSMRTFDTQHACFGGTAGLLMATDWVLSGSAAGRAALVIASDLARYDLKSAGEPTQGGGAVAMLISDRPRLLELDGGLTGSFASDVHDFWRPLGRREALVDGHYSINCYLDALAGAYRQWRGRASAREIVRYGDVLPSEQLARIAYHVPFCKMARKAHERLRRCDLEDTKGAPLDPDTERAEAERFGASFAAQVTPTLALCSRIGNAYTAALYLGLAGMLQHDAAALAGRRVGLFSYGSGCSAEFFSGTVLAEAKDVIAKAALEETLARRERICIDAYEELMARGSSEPLPNEPAPGTFKFIGVKENRRTYARG